MESINVLDLVVPVSKETEAWTLTVVSTPPTRGTPPEAVTETPTETDAPKVYVLSSVKEYSIVLFYSSK